MAQATKAIKGWEWTDPSHAQHPLKHAKWNGLSERLHVFQALCRESGAPTDAKVLAWLWALEHDTFLYTRGVAGVYMQRACQLVVAVRDTGVQELMRAHPDASRLAWLDEQHWGRNQTTERARQTSNSKFETATKLSRVQLEVPEDLAGGMKCGKCGSHDLTVVLRQTRSGDEGMTAFVTCKVCHHNW